MSKTYVLDTNVLLSDPDCLFAFEENELLIPLAVLEELDRHKSRPDEVGKNARSVSRKLDELRKVGNLFKGVVLHTGGTLKVVSVGVKSLQTCPEELQTPKVDNIIIALMMQLTARCAIGEQRPILVSKDINVRLKCDSLGLECDDYLKMRITSDPDTIYRGVDVLEVEEHQVDNFFINKKLPLADIELNGVTVCPNQIVVIKSIEDGETTKSAITKYVEQDKAFMPLQKFDSVFGLKPRNKEQAFSLDLLFDDRIKILTLVGPAGTGKTILVLAAALEQLKGIGAPETAKYDKLIVSRPVQPMGKEIGFLPGTLVEKMEPWIAPIRDNLNYLVNNKRQPLHAAKVKKNYVEDVGKPRSDNGEYLSLMQERGLIEIEALTFIRGRSIPNAIIIIDEAQNLSMHELKTIVTRVGEGTKIILTGDIEQIDNSNVDVYTNGLSFAVEKFKHYAIAGHVTLIKGERSELATLASQIL